MLVLTRKTSQAIQLGDDITITVVRTSHGSVKLGISAPPDVRIARPEILAQLGEIEMGERTGPVLELDCRA